MAEARGLYLTESTPLTMSWKPPYAINGTYGGVRGGHKPPYSILRNSLPFSPSHRHSLASIVARFHPFGPPFHLTCEGHFTPYHVQLPNKTLYKCIATSVILHDASYRIPGDIQKVRLVSMRSIYNH